MDKKLIIMIASAGLISFGGMFAFAWLTNKSTPQSQAPQADQPTPARRDQQEMQLSLLRPEPAETGAAANSKMKKAMTEKQLKGLVYEIREKIQEYEGKLQGLQTREERLQIAHNMIKKDIKELNNLQVELASIVASVKEQRNKLLQSRVQIARSEKANLMKIAATYDKMKATGASKILINMCTSQMQTTGSGGLGSNMNDAVKILHYMTERTKAKLLAELSTSEPTLAAVLCQKLKQIIEE